jgi:ABC-type branched-subunit amino acid transport system ATPase component/ABC-type branched-subunit amino acid transport system permease subunit
LVPIGALIVFLLWFGSAQARNRYWMQIGVEAMWVAAAVVGLNVLLGYTGLLSLGHAAFFIVGGFVGAIWTVQWGLDPWLGFPIAFVVGMTLGAVLALTCCHLRGFYLTVVTIAFGILVSSIALLFYSHFNGLSGRPVAKPLDTEFSFISSTNPNRYLVGLYWIGVGMLLVCLYMVWNLVHSRWGRAYKAIREAEVAAGASGVPTYRYKVSSFALSAGMVSLAGVLAAQTTLQVRMVDGTSVVGQSFQLVIDAVVGGLGTLAGPIVGAFVFTLGLGVDIGGESVSDRLGQWETAFLASLVMVMVIVAPEGLVGLFRRIASPTLRWLQSPVPADGPVVVPAPKHTAEPGTPLLDVTDLTLTFGGLAALSSVSLALESGTIHALIGPNGSGKSTLVNVVTGIYRPDSGRVRFRGDLLTAASPHRCARVGIARTFQNCQIWRRMTVLQNVLVGAHTATAGDLVRSLLIPMFLRPWERRAHARALGLLRFVGLAERANDRAGALPFADQRLLEIARALASNPDLLILDEPAAGMHPTEVRQLVALVQRVRSLGITVLLIEHHMEVVSELADRVTVLNFGRVIAQAAPEEVAANREVIAAYLGEKRGEEPERVRVTAMNALDEDRAPIAPMLCLRNVRVFYGGAPALDGIDLDVYAGEIIALIGANGAGKTTTLKTISGVSELLKSVRGEITFLGTRIDQLPAHRIARLGIVQVPEGRRVFPESTVDENLLLGAYARRDRDIAADVEAVYERFPVLGTRRHQPAGLLSGGEQQMLAFGRALTARPGVLLLDEPSHGLAPIIIDEVFEVLRGLAAEHVTILLVEQLATRALTLADRAYILETGRIVKTGTGAELARDHEVTAAYLGG